MALEQGYAEAEARDSGTEAKVREQFYVFPTWLQYYKPLLIRNLAE